MKVERPFQGKRFQAFRKQNTMSCNQNTMKLERFFQGNGFSQFLVTSGLPTNHPEPGLLLSTTPFRGNFHITLHSSGRFGYDNNLFRKIFRGTLDQLFWALSRRSPRK